MTLQQPITLGRRRGAGMRRLHRIFTEFDYALWFRSLALIAFATAYCFLVGASILVLPTGFVALEVAAPIALLLWSAPDIKVDYSRYLLFLVHVFIYSQIAIPNFYAIPVTGFGWVNLRKLEIFLLLSLTALAYATSKDVRTRALDIFQASKLFNYCLLGFLAMLVISVPLSKTPQVSASLLAQPFTTWYLAYFAVLAIKDVHLKLDGIAKSLVVNIAIIAVVCIFERRLQRRVMFDIMPSSLINSLLENPSFAMLYLSSGLRAGAFRAVASFTTALSTGECAAMVMPFTFYLAFHRAGAANKLFGYVGLMSVAAVLITTNARGAMLAAIAACLVYLLLVIILLGRRDRSSLIPPVVSLTALSLLPSAALTNKFRYAVFGGGATSASNAGRSEQMRLAIPKFFQSPIWGHGIGNGAETVGFNPGAYFTLDSYAVAIAIEAGLPGLMCLLIVLFYPVVAASRLMVASNGSRLALEGVILALPIFAFGINMLVLAQIENHGFLFLILGLFAAWRWHERSVGENVGVANQSAALRYDSLRV